MSLLNILAHDKNVILYRPELNKITGNPLATILLSQIIYWSRKYGHEEFYKNIFVSNKKAKENNQKSWSEELGFSRRQIETAFDALKRKSLISVRVNTLEHNTYVKIDKKQLNEELKTVYDDSRSQKSSECTKRTIGVDRNGQPGVAETYIPSITETTQRLHKEGSKNSLKNSKNEIDLKPTAHRIKKILNAMSVENKIKVKSEVENYLEKFPIIKNVKAFRLGVLNAKIKKYASN